MKRLTLAILLAVLAIPAAAAPPAPRLFDECAAPGKDGPAPVPFQGVVNSYFSGAADIAADAKTLTISNASGKLDYYGGGVVLQEGDLLLLIQMQDADIAATDDANYGANNGSGAGYTALNSTGLYEYVRVDDGDATPLETFTVADTIPIVGEGATGGTLNAYRNANATVTTGQRRFQVIRVPQYTTGTLTSALDANPWNGTTGGVFAIDVRDNLDLGGATLNMSGKGFRGGGGRRLVGNIGGSNTAFRTFSAANNQRYHASKGEGIAGTPRFVNNPATGTVLETLPAYNPPGEERDGYENGSNAKGAPGTAGGGGTDGDPNSNNLNSGGGGGGNGGPGGRGGFAAVTGTDGGGRGGVFFPATAGRIVMGGGGGAGSRKATPDSGLDSSGGAGGGIVLIRAYSVSNSGGPATITVNGSNGVGAQSENGGGGGGAGGTVVFTVLNSNGFTGTNLTIEAKGGNGADANFDPGDTSPFGPGAGGGGGVVLLSHPTPIVDTGGLNGQTRDGSGNPISYGSTVGTTPSTAPAGTATPPVTNLPPSSVPGVHSGAECSSVSIAATPLQVSEGAATPKLIFTVSLPAANGTAFDIPYTVSHIDTANADFAAPPVGGTLNFLATDLWKTIEFDIFQDTLYEPNEGFQVTIGTPTGANPPRLGDTSAIATILDDDALPTVSWTAATSGPHLESSAGTVTVQAQLSAVSGLPVTVGVQIDQTTVPYAIYGSDFTTTPAAAGSPPVYTLTIPAGSLTGDVTINILDDSAFEPSEFIRLTMTSATNASLTGSPLHTVEITSDAGDLQPQLSIDSPAAVNESSGSVTFTVTASPAPLPGAPVTFRVIAPPGAVPPTDTAVAGQDYTARLNTSPLLTIDNTTPGAQVAVAIPITDDLLDEDTEVFTAQIIDVNANAQVAVQFGVATILDDNDALPTLSISAAPASIAEGNGGFQSVTFTVTLTPVSGRDVAVTYATADGSASAAGGDYSPVASTTYTFPAGQTTHTFSAAVNGDTVNELSETFTATLTSPVNAVLGTDTATVTIVNDDTPADLVLVKSANPTTVAPGGTVVYTLSLSYTGPIPATGVTVIDLLPSDVTWASDNSGGDYNPATGVWTIPGAIASGAPPTTIDITVTVKPDTASKTIVNQATIGSGLQNDVDALNNQSSVAVTVTVPDLDITTTTLPGGSEGAAYSATVSATGGLPAYAWTIASVTSLPALVPSLPFSIDASSGVISGTPAVAGTYDFVVRVTDAQNPADSDDQPLQIVVAVPSPASAPVLSVPPALSATVGVPFTYPFTATNVVGGTSWSLSPNPQNIPSGLSFNTSTGVLSGTPLALPSATPVTSNLTLGLSTTGNTPAAAAPVGVAITVNPNPITITTDTLPPGDTTTPYYQIVKAVGGVGPTFTWTVPSGFSSWPPGLGFGAIGKDVEITGTPTANGTYVFTLRATDDFQTGVFDDQTFIIIVSTPTPGQPPTITTTSLPDGSVSDPYSVQLTAFGGTLPYTWSIVSGTLPGTVLLDPVTGIISGVPNTDGSVSDFVVQVTDAAGRTDTQELSLTVRSPLWIYTPTPLNSAVQGQAYFALIEAIGGQQPYVWSIDGGTRSGSTWSLGGLATGLSLHQMSGTISGVVSAAPGTSSFTIRVTDALGVTNTKAFSFAVIATGPPPQVLTTQLPLAYVGLPYAATLQAGAGAPPYTGWNAVIGAPLNLPAGLTFNLTTGVISGIPTTAGTTNNIQFSVRDSTPLDSSPAAALSLRVKVPLSILTSSLPVGQPNVPYATVLVENGGTGGFVWEVLQDALPPGLSLNSTTGIILGTVQQTGSWTFRVQVTDTDGDTAQKLMTIVIGTIAGLENSLNVGYCSGSTLPPSGAPWAALAGSALSLLAAFRLKKRGIRS